MIHPKFLETQQNIVKSRQFIICWRYNKIPAKSVQFLPALYVWFHLSAAGNFSRVFDLGRAALVSALDSGGVAFVNTTKL